MSNAIQSNKYQIGDFVRSRRLKSKGKIVSYNLSLNARTREPVYYVLMGTHTGGVYLPESDLMKTSAFGFHNTNDHYYKSRLRHFQQQ